MAKTFHFSTPKYWLFLGNVLYDEICTYGSKIIFHIDYKKTRCIYLLTKSNLKADMKPKKALISSRPSVQRWKDKLIQFESVRFLSRSLFSHVVLFKIAMITETWKPIIYLLILRLFSSLFLIFVVCLYMDIWVVHIWYAHCITCFKNE